jgi:hypothetical protein
VLAWNDDATAITAKFALESTELLVDAMAGRRPVTVLGTPIDLAKVDCDSFHVAGYTDHITPWRAAYTSTQVLGGDKQMAVVKSGHIQSFVNPATKSRYDYWEGPPDSDDPDRWLAGATEHHGSWWPQWIEWLTARDGRPQRAIGRLGQPLLLQLVVEHQAAERFGGPRPPRFLGFRHRPVAYRADRFSENSRTHDASPFANTCRLRTNAHHSARSRSLHYR